MMLYFWPQQYLEVFHNIMHDDLTEKHIHLYYDNRRIILANSQKGFRFSIEEPLKDNSDES